MVARDQHIARIYIRTVIARIEKWRRGVCSYALPSLPLLAAALTILAQVVPRTIESSIEHHALALDRLRAIGLSFIFDLVLAHCSARGAMNVRPMYLFLINPIP